MEGPVEERKNEPKYKGVRKRKWGKWVSEVRLPNSRERIWLGSYDTAEKAARAFDAAQCCLRGPNAKFNFPESPPNISGGQRLSPAEIQVVAAQFAKDYRRQRQVEEPLHDHNDGTTKINSHVIKLEKEEETSPSSTSNNDHVGQMETTMDWTFLDMLEQYPHLSGASDNNVPPLSSSSSPPRPPPSPRPVPSPSHENSSSSTYTTTTFDFGYYPGLETLSSNLYSPTHLPPRSGTTPNYDENDDNGNGDENYYQQSFLWNF